jgi:ubiquinone/menaquinone biosynthesis C-methylase UbiE
MNTIGKTVFLREMLDAFQCIFLSLLSRRYNALTGERKLNLFKGIRGNILEIGAGTGVNFAFIPAGVRWIGVDSNPHSLRYIREAAQRSGHEFDFHTGSAESLPFPDASFDSVASTLTLCSMQDPVLALDEIRRVLRPGGQFLFLEHVAAAAGSQLRRRQRLLRPVFRCLAGCTPDRDTGSLIRAARFSSVEMEQFVLPLPIVGPHICGRAVR